MVGIYSPVVGQDGAVLGPAHAWVRERGAVLGGGPDPDHHPYRLAGLARRLLLC